MAVLLSGKPVAEHMCRDIRLRCEKLSRRGVTPTLGIVRVGRRRLLPIHLPCYAGSRKEGSLCSLYKICTKAIR